MKKKITIILSIILLIMIIISLTYTYNTLNSVDQESLEREVETMQNYDIIGQQFELPEVINTKTSTSDHIQLDSKLNVINVWASWCGPCNEEMPDLVDIDNRYDDKDVSIIGINIEDSKTQSKKFLDKYHVKYNSYTPVDEDQFIKDNTVSMIPTTFFVNQSGEILYVKYGALSEDVVSFIYDEMEGK